MTYSRVGVVPEPAYSKDVKGLNKSRNNRSKGITMEDLKKQTALRLAKEHNMPIMQEKGYTRQNEQQYGQFHSRNYNNSYDTPSSDPSASYPRKVHYPDRTSQELTGYVSDGITKTNFSYNNGEQQRLSGRDQHQYQNQHLEQSNGYLGAPNFEQSNYMSPQDQNVIPSGPSTEIYVMDSYHSSNYTRSKEPQIISRSVQPLQPAPALCLPPNTMHHLQNKQAPALYPTDEPHPSTISRVNSNPSKNKLPHGLTVYELKEMTKARLQSEATEKSDEIQEIHATPRDPRVSPLEFDSAESLRERTLSHDMSPPSLINSNGSYLHNQLIPPKTVPVKLHPRSQAFQSEGYQSSTILGGGTAPSPFRDTWESTSVGSYNSTIYSENMGSESASEVGSFSHSSHRNRAFTNPAVQGFQPLDVTNHSTSSSCRDARSFSNPSPIQASPHRGSGMIGGTSIFNATVGGNRRRAVTLSPNTGSILEDRPLYDDLDYGDRLEIPNFSSIGLSATTPTRNRQREYSPVLEQLGLGIDNSYASNGTESSNVFRRVANNNGSSLPGIAQMGSREHDGLGTFPTSHAKTKSNFFGEVSAEELGVPAPPPGFTTSSPSPSNENAFSRVMSRDSYPNSNVKNTWEPINHNQNRRHLVSEDNLVNDFGSLLDLSGSRGDRERANTYTFGSNHSNSIASNFSGGF